MPNTRARPEPAPSNALIVGDDAELLAQLRDYLAQAGVQASATRRLDEAWRRARGQAVILFPDEFDAGEVTDGLSRLIARAPCPRVIVITAGPCLFEPLIESLGSPQSVVILPKPVWGWAILDLLRDWESARP